MLKPEPANEGDRRRVLRRVSVGVLVAVAAAAVWYAVAGSGPGATTARGRTAFDFVVTWRCLACGHSEDAAAAIGPHACGKCGKRESYASIRYACPTHGAVAVAFQYDERGKPSQVRVGSGGWIAHHDDEGNLNTRCPQCRAYMMPAEPMRPRVGR